MIGFCSCGSSLTLRIVISVISTVNRLDGKHVVFGSVVEGMDVVRAVEGVGSGSGATRAKVVVEDCGQL